MKTTINTKLKWDSSDYYPLKEALVKSGILYNGSPEGANTPVAGLQVTYGPQGPIACGIIDTVATFFPNSYPVAGDLCDATFANFDLSVNYCSVRP